MKRSLSLLLLAVVSLGLFFTACEIGLGESLDLEAPQLSITEPANFSYQPLNFTIKGTCSDNKAVKNVVILNKETGKEYGQAIIQKDTWYFDVSIPKEEEGEITFRIEANDKAGNTSTHSARNITLLVDEHAPEAKSWYVDRGNSIQTALERKEFLQGLDFTLSENKNYPQNQHFTLYGNFYDAMGIDTITVKLFEDDFSTTNPVVSKTVNVDNSSENYIGDGKSIYTPSFYFDETDFVNGNPLCASGKHYLRVVYYAKDNNDPVNFNDAEVNTEKYILWYPESDAPGIQQIQINNEGSIRVSVGSSIPVDFFDDDGLKEVYCSLKTSITGDPQTYAQSIVSTESVRTSAFTVDPSKFEVKVSKTNFPTTSFQTDYPTQIEAPSIPSQMYLIGCALDVNDKWNARVIPVEVVDAEKPMLFVISPSENEYPHMESDGRNFKFTGNSLDTKGSEYIKIAYIPTEDEDRAKELLDEYKDDRSSKKVISGTGEIIWCQEFSSGQTTDDGWKKQSFDISMNLFEDFKDASGASTAKLEKFFEILLVDSDGNNVYKPFIIQGDSTTPLIDIQTPETELKVHDYTVSDLDIKFKGYKNSGIAIDSSKYKITTKIGSTIYSYVVGSGNPALTVDSEGYANLTIPKATLTSWITTESQPTFTFYATDILGNGGVGEDMRAVILSPRPVINSITVDKNNGTYPAGTVMKFKVTFSREVKIEGNPKLVLKYSASDASPKYVSYSEGSGTNALTFTWTVPSDAVSSKLICAGLYTSAENVLADNARICATELGEGDIYTSISNAEVLSGKEIALDGVAPKINSIEITSSDGNLSGGNYYCTTNKTVSAVIKTSKPVVVNGSPKLQLKVESSDVLFSFANMKDENGGTTITFDHKVISTGTNKTPEGQLSYELAACFTTDDQKLLLDNTGNIIDLTKNTSAAISTVYIDYTAPTSAPGLKDISHQQIYLTNKTIELTGIDSGATGFYSLDGGVSWKTYDPENKQTVGSGSYKIITYQQDKAGNKSVYSSPCEIAINSSFTDVIGLSIEEPDGYYKAGNSITFKLIFEDNVVISAATDIKLKFKTLEDGKTDNREVNVTVPSGNKTKEASFVYTVQAGDAFNSGITVDTITFISTFKDEVGNTPDFAGTPKQLTSSNCSFIGAENEGKRSGVILDAVLPAISTYAPAAGGVATMTDNSSGTFKIVLTFSENVYKETGDIILQRKGAWYIPAVMTVAEFDKYYNQMTTANKAKLLKLAADGSELLHSQTGQPVGPYQKITHGLKVVNGKYVPDEETKYVLAYQLGLDSGTATLDGNEISVADIRSALESVNYHQHKVDVASNYVKVGNDGKTVEITFQEAVEDGREWELIIPATAFRDNAENFYKGMNVTGATDTYSMWSNNVAQPVVRVDRYTHGWGASEPNDDGTDFTNITVNNGKYHSQTIQDNSAAALAPTGYVRVRIDCETPGASIKYSKVFNDGTVYTTDVPAGASYNAGTVNDNTTYHTNKRNTVADITQTNLEKRGATSYAPSLNGIIVGDGLYTTARKDYITAYATKTGFVASQNGYEGIFKTIVYIYSATNSVACLNVEGGTAPGGQPNVNGFPLRDATDEDDPNGAGRYSKNCYIIDGNTRKNFVFLSYEIISSNWAILLCGTNHSRDYPLNSYGEAAYITALTFWGGTNVQ